NLTIDKVGTGYTLTATSGTLTQATSNSFNITAAPPPPATHLAFGVQPRNTQVGATITPAVKVTALDASGRTSTGLNGGNVHAHGQVASPTRPATDPNLTIDKVGTGYTLTATSGTLTQATSNAFNITAAPPPPATHLAFGVQPRNTQVGVAITPAVTVTALDASGNTVPSFTGAISLALGNAGGATLAGNGPVNAVNGVATFANLTIDRAGTGYTLMATSGTLTQATSNAFNITPAPPPTGDLTVTAATTGQSMPSSYTVTVDGGQSRIIGANGGSTTYTGLSATDHTAALTDVPANCTASGGNSKTVTVPAGGTGHADFTITCAAPNQPPTAAFTSSCSGLTCSFTDQSTD